ncbi:hypothetical protein CRG98_023876 [Punica granatum]|uniref:Uncharacterized protein n=1 Tax=Punica granatum TaxID=22663 RepID=A0A2I0JHL7_PUNGR|nr:hypothetical protein CRG98_023876 [Punica granatum]
MERLLALLEAQAMAATAIAPATQAPHTLPRTLLVSYTLATSTLPIIMTIMALVASVPSLGSSMSIPITATPAVSLGSLVSMFILPPIPFVLPLAFFAPTNVFASRPKPFIYRAGLSAPPIAGITTTWAGAEQDRRLKRIEEAMKSMHGLRHQRGLSYEDLCLFSQMSRPQKFKVPKFKKYNGIRNPMVHFRLYLAKMDPYKENEPNPGISAGLGATKGTTLKESVHPLPVFVSKSYWIMLQKGWIAPEPCRAGYCATNPNAHCEFHMDTAGHSMEICPGLRHMIQDFIDIGKLKFNAVQLPNVSVNPFLVHTSSSEPSVDMIGMMEI